MWFFGSAEKKDKVGVSDEGEERKVWNNDEKPSHESVLWRFRTLKNIREGNVPKLRKVNHEKRLEIIPVSYKRGTVELAEPEWLCRETWEQSERAEHEWNEDRCRSPSMTREEGEVISDDNEFRPRKNPKGSKAKKRKKKKTRR